MTKKAKPRVFTTENGTTFEPWVCFPMVGYKVTTRAGLVSFLYFNPSGSTDDDTDNAFVYLGPTGDPAHDGPVTYIDVAVDA